MTLPLKNEPNILYLGTPVVLISTENADYTYNIAPMSSAFWLGWRGILGLAATSKTTEDLIRTRQCVLNLPSINLVGAVNKLARTTGSNPVPDGKLRRGYRFEPEKFTISGLSPVASETVRAPRIAECPVQLEAVVEALHPVAEHDPAQKGRIMCIEVRIQRVHLHDDILLDGDPNRVDPDLWRPLIMSFQHFYGLGDRLHPSTLAEIPEAMYRGPDIDRARTVA
jgi:flavin reductase (DIM6/NTAB) family NADH-FMN oxidoreductase RutF